MKQVEAIDQDLLSYLLDLAVQIQQIPAPTFFETQRSQFLHALFQREGLADIVTDNLGNVYARLPGLGERYPIVVSAHTDTVFPASTQLDLVRRPKTITGPAIGDNSLGVASLVGLVRALRRKYQQSKDVQPGSVQRNTSHLPGDLWLVANVGEEGLGDLRGMQEVIRRFGDQPLAYIVVEGMALGQIYHRGLGVKRLRIEVSTSGGHSWVDYGVPSAIHEIASIITRLTALKLPAQPRTTLNVGVISGGVSVNTIAPSAFLELDLRSEEEWTLHSLVNQVENLVGEASRDNAHARVQVIGSRPFGEISANHQLVRLAKQCIEAQDLQAHFNIGSTDANIPLSHGLPSVCIGITNGYCAHTQNETIHLPPVVKGLAQLVMLVERAFDELG